MNPKRKATAFLVLALIVVVISFVALHHHRVGERHDLVANLRNRTVASYSDRVATREKSRNFPARADPATSKIAFETLRRAFSLLANAHSYEVLTITDVAGKTPEDSVATTLCLRSWTRGTLLRYDVAFYNEKTRAWLDGWTDITNESGNWELKDLPGVDKVAFLILSDKVPVPTVQMDRSFSQEAAQTSPGAIAYSERSGTYNGQPATIITDSRDDGADAGTRYIVFANTGALAAMQMDASGIEDRFTLNPNISPEEFDIPKDRTIVPTSDVEQSADLLEAGAYGNRATSVP